MGALPPATTWSKHTTHVSLFALQIEMLLERRPWWKRGSDGKLLWAGGCSVCCPGAGMFGSCPCTVGMWVRPPSAASGWSGCVLDHCLPPSPGCLSKRLLGTLNITGGWDNKRRVGNRSHSPGRMCALSVSPGPCRPRFLPLIYLMIVTCLSVWERCHLSQPITTGR